MSKMRALNEDFMSVSATNEEILQFQMYFWTSRIDDMKTKVTNLIIKDLGNRANDSIDSWGFRTMDDAIKLHASLDTSINDRTLQESAHRPIDDKESKSNFSNQQKIDLGANCLDEDSVGSI